MLPVLSAVLYSINTVGWIVNVAHIAAAQPQAAIFGVVLRLA